MSAGTSDRRRSSVATSTRVRGEMPGERRSVRRSEPEKKRKFPLPVLIIAAVVLTVLLVLLGRFCSLAATIDVTVNGNALSLHGAKTLDTAIRESGLPINPGDFIALDGVVLKRGEGNPFYATVNGEETLDRNRALANGDEVYLTDGTDIVEDYDVVEESYPCGIIVLGIGAICTFEEGVPKIVEHLTGRISGAEVDRLKQAKEEAVAQWHEPDVGDDKVIALTFDCGPSTEYTNQILNVLAEQEVKATFFCQGDHAEANPGLVKREQEEGHQIASNTYSYTITENSGADTVLSEVQKGFEAIDEVLGEKQERIVRFPGALLTSDMALQIADEVDAVIGWNIDSGDWLGTDSDSICETLMEVEPGEIVLLHDGGYYCEGTAEALRKAIPKLKENGYSFITIDELMKYPAKSED